MVEAVLKHRHRVLARRLRRLLGLVIVAAGSVVFGSQLMGFLS